MNLARSKPNMECCPLQEYLKLQSPVNILSYLNAYNPQPTFKNQLTYEMCKSMIVNYSPRKLDNILLSVFLKKCTTELQIKDSLNFIKEKRDLLYDENVYNAVLENLIKIKEFKEALKYLEKMKADGVKPNLYTLYYSLKIYGELAMKQEFYELEDSIEQEFSESMQGNIKSAFVYSTLIENCAILKDEKRTYKYINLAEQLIAAKEDVIEAVPSVLFKSVIFGLAIFDDITALEKFTKRITSLNVKLNLEMYQSLIESFGIIRDLKNVSFFYDGFLSSKIPANTSFLNTLMSAYTNCSAYQKTFELFDQYFPLTCKLDAFTVSIVLKTIATSKNSARFIDSCKSFSALGWKFTQENCNMLIRCLCTFELQDQCFKLFDLMIDDCMNERSLQFTFQGQRVSIQLRLFDMNKDIQETFESFLSGNQEHIKTWESSFVNSGFELDHADKLRLSQ